MLREVFEFGDYRKYLIERLGGRGSRAALCKAMRCQTAYLSHVLHERAHLSLEQAQVVNRYLAHDEEQGHYFMLLVQSTRAGTQELQKYFERQRQELLRERQALRNRLENKIELSEEQRARYYRDWYCGAVHILLMIPGLRTARALSERLSLPLAVVQDTLDFLLRAGLAREQAGEYRVSDVWMHLEHDSPWIDRHHMNMRYHAMKSLERGRKSEDLHFSTIYTLSQQDYAVVRERFIKFLEGVDELARPSPEEDAFVMNIDWYRL